MTQDRSDRAYVVVLRTSSAAAIGEGRGMGIHATAPGGQPVLITFRTHYADEGFDALVPRGLVAEVVGRAETMDSALTNFASIANGIVNVVACATNAAVDDFEQELAYDATPDSAEREFFQQRIQPVTGFPRPSRLADIDATIALHDAIATNTEADRLSRAMAQYREALRHWLPGHEILCAAHIWMGIETLTKPALRRLCASDTLTVDDLLAKWGIEKKQLDSQVRERILFKGDTACFSSLRDASNGLEHGFIPLPAIRDAATAWVQPGMKYLREAIMDLADVPEPANRTLLSAPFDAPRYSYPMTSILRGHLKGNGDSLAASGERYPRFEWASSIQEWSLDGAQYRLTATDTMTAKFGDGISFDGKQFEVWGPKPG